MSLEYYMALLTMGVARQAACHRCKSGYSVNIFEADLELCPVCRRCFLAVDGISDIAYTGGVPCLVSTKELDYSAKKAGQPTPWLKNCMPCSDKTSQTIPALQFK